MLEPKVVEMRSVTVSLILTLLLRIVGFIIFGAVLVQLGITPNFWQWVGLGIGFMIMVYGSIKITFKDRRGRKL